MHESFLEYYKHYKDLEKAELKRIRKEERETHMSNELKQFLIELKTLRLAQKYAYGKSKVPKDEEIKIT